jgi:hypothetical protein
LTCTQKNSKCVFYLRSLLSRLVPLRLYRTRLYQHLNSIGEKHRDAIEARVSYYNKCNAFFVLGAASQSLRQLSSKQQSAYYYDLRKVLRYFPESLRFHHEFGDVIKVPLQPCIVKSRPIEGDNRNSIILQLNRVRHYVFAKDEVEFVDKKDMVVWRGKSKPAHCRSELVRNWFAHPRCDIGQSNKVPLGANPGMRKQFLTINEQLGYKFILSVEGNDVATNLKWIMSSNSLCLMRKPRYETWFMEGLLQAGVHYVLLKDDFSDLEEKMDFYSKHPEAALMIIANANRWVDQFRDDVVERHIGLQVMQKYFEYSGQVLDAPALSLSEA